MAFDLKPGLLREISLNLSQVIASKADHRAATGADQVMLMPQWLGGVATAVVFLAMDFMDKPKRGKYLQGAVDGNQPNVGISLTHPLVHGSRGKMPPTANDDAQHGAPLGCKLITLLA